MSAGVVGAEKVLPAGRELDALVAEKVMGWTAGAGFENATYWAFSTDIAAAWLVVERLANMNPDADAADSYLIDIRVDLEPWVPDGGPYAVAIRSQDCERDWFGVAETFPLAVCRAALALFVESPAARGEG